jgi:hypothetical protein
MLIALDKAVSGWVLFSWFWAEGNFLKQLAS